MDNQSTPNNKQVNPKSHPLTALAFLEIGLFEIIFVTVGVLLLLGTINYFNLLPVSKVFPKYLGWLPRQQTKIASQGETLQSYEQKSTSVPRPTAIPPDNTENAKRVLANFASENLKPSILEFPENITFTKDTATNADKNVLYASWNSKAGTVSATLHLVPDTQGISSLYLSSIYKTNNPTVLSLDTSQSISSKIFKTKTYGVWKCAPLAGTTYCENFGEDVNGVKIGISISQLNNLLSRFYLGYCEFHKEAKPMYTWKSCSLPFSKTGITP